MKDFETLKKSILNEAFQSINEDIQDYMRRKAVLESFGYEYDMDKLPKPVNKFAEEVNVEEKNRLRFFDIVEFNKRD